MFALIPAAGRSTRMGRPKLALPLGGRTVLERVIAALRDTGAEVLVILAPHTTELAGPAGKSGAMVLQLEQQTQHMRATIEHGLDYLATRSHPSPYEPWLLVPADHPTLDADLIRPLIESFRLRPDCSIAMPTYEGKRGHPALIRWQHWPGIRAFSPDVGLNTYLRQFPGETLEVPVDSPDVLLDLDTPEDYGHLLRRYS